MCLPKETKNINFEAFNMLTNKKEAKTITKYISCNFTFDNTKCNSNQNWNNKTWQCKCKNYHK